MMKIFETIYLSISREETIYILNILFLNMLGTDDSDLSYLLVQASALFDRNECPNMDLEQIHVYPGYFHYYHRKHDLMDDQVC